MFPIQEKRINCFAYKTDKTISVLKIVLQCKISLFCRKVVDLQVLSEIDYDSNLKSSIVKEIPRVNASEGTNCERRIQNAEM